MKPKVSPTSPKVSKKHNVELEKLYGSDFKTIDKPRKQKTVSIWLLLLVVLLGLLAGLLGPILLLSYGQNIPYLSKLNIFSYPTQTSFFITGNKKTELISSEDIEKIALAISPTVVQFYVSRENENDLDRIYIPSESVASGFVLTEDGYIITRFSDFDVQNDYAAVLSDGSAYMTEYIMNDPATDFLFFRIDQKNMSTVTIANSGEVLQSDYALIARHLYPGEKPTLMNVQIANPSGKQTGYDNDFIISSDTYDNNILLGTYIPENFNNGVAYTLQGEVLGIESAVDFGNIIVPFDRIQAILGDVLAEKNLIRPYLGVRYIDLSQTVGIASELSQGLTSGALLFASNDVHGDSIEAGSPGERGGLIEGDVITSIDGKIINAFNSLSESILNHRIDDLVTVTVVRDGKELDLKITLEGANN